MPKEFEGTAPNLSEIDTLRREVARLKDIEQRCQKANAALKTIQERNRLLGDSTPLGIFTIDVQGGITGINRKMLEIVCLAFRRRPHIDEYLRLSAPDCIGDRGRYSALHRPKQTGGRRTSLHRPPGFLHPSALLSQSRSGSDGAVSGVMAIVEDYTDMKRTEEALRESEKRYRQLFQSAPFALIEWDVSHLKAYLEKLRTSDVSDFREYLERHPREVHHCWSLIKTVDYNQAFLKLMGVADSAGPNGDFIPTDAEGFLRMAREIILVAAAGNTAEEREETIVTTTGEPKIVLGKSLVVSGHEDTMARVAIAMVDISQRKKAEDALRESERRFRDQALRDGLTGLYNQRYLYQSLAVWIDSAKNTDTPISVIFMDLDHFKTIVDTHGHINGSRAIRKVAGTIGNCLQEPAFAVAYAGDEFVVVLPGIDQPQALQIASEIRASVKNTVYVLDQGIEVRLRASFGIATFPQHAADLNGLIAAADHALFAIKEAGKDAIGQFK